MADHTLLGFDSDVHVTNFGNVDTMITDMGALPSQRLEYAQSGKIIWSLARCLQPMNELPEERAKG